ncbi:MAG: TrmB family transcriptional regulator [Candidatus Aenigmarchaeota archaeon]|nr:TrmB family transcriptional regulator [Candidatus Aenigmarchaeota archaeon]
MVASTETLDALKSIGLNLYERKIYVALLARGVATAAELSELANVPRSRSYDVLESLAEKGFAMVQPSKPIKYVALEPKEALERVKQNLEKNYETLVSRIEKMAGSKVLNELEQIHKQSLSLMTPADLIGTLKGRHTINRQLRTLFRDAKSKISIVTTEQGLNDLYSNHFRMLKKIARRGAKVKILAPLSNTSATNALSQVAELRHLPFPSGRIFLIDDKHVLFALTDDKDVHETQDVAFWANSNHAAKDIIKPYFESMWQSGSKHEK